MTCRLQLALVRDDIVGRSDNCIVMAQNHILIRVASSASQQNLQCLFHHCKKVHHQADAQNHREYLRVPISRWTFHAGKDHLHDQVSPSPNGDIAIMTFSFTAAARWANMIQTPPGITVRHVNGVSGLWPCTHFDLASLPACESLLGQFRRSGFSRAHAI